MTRRKYELDNLKGILIFLVVLGHLLISFTHATSELASKIVAYIYFFHMPLFLIISGFLTHKKLNKKSIIYLIVVFLSMNISYSLYDYYVSGVLDLFILKYSSWYILLLLIYRLIINTSFFQNILNKNKSNVLLVTVVVSLIIQVLPINSELKRLFGNFYYFLFGYLLIENKKLFNIKCDKNIFCIIIILIFAIMFLGINITTDLNFYFGFSYGRKCDVVLKSVQLMINSILFIFVLNVLPRCKLKFLAKFGKNSLYI